MREAELRAVLHMYGAKPPIFLGYRDQEVSQANMGELVARVASVMTAITPDVVITFGPMGLSGHPDHVAVHRATVAAFHQYRNVVGTSIACVIAPPGQRERGAWP